MQKYITMDLPGILPKKPVKITRPRHIPEMPSTELPFEIYRGTIWKPSRI